jgi:hypothetical protein
MSVGVVHFLETVHVHDQNGCRFPLPVPRQDGLVQPIVQEGTVRQLRESIVKGLVFERLGLGLLLGNIPQDADEKLPAPQKHSGAAELDRKGGSVLAPAPHLA